MKIYSLNPGLSLRNIIPEGVYNNSENFVQFLKAYYEWMHTTEFTVEIISGTFVKGEALLGQVSKTSATISQLKNSNTTFIVFVTGTRPFELFETLVGQTSGAQARLVSIKDNILRHTAQLTNYRDLSKSIDQFEKYLKDELYYAIPASYDGNKRDLAKRLRDFYLSKGQEQAYAYFMKTLYNQDIEITYPGDEILRVSDGNYSKQTIIRADISADPGSSEIFNFLFKTIRGRTSGAIANVTNIKKVFIGSTYLAEMNLSLVSGVFAAGEIIYDIADLTPTPLEATLYGLVSDYQIVDSGSGYYPGDFLTVTGDGEQAVAQVTDIYRSGIDSIKVNTVGHGYRVGTQATIDNSGTEGSNLAVIVTGLANSYNVTLSGNTYTLGEISEITVVNRGENYFKEPTVTLVDTHIASLGLLTDRLIQIVNPGINYTVGDSLVFTSVAGIGAAAHIASVVEANTFSNIYFENGDKLMSEQNFDIIKYETWFNKGPIARIVMTNYGSAYDANALPTIGITTATGAGGNLVVTGLQGTSANVQVDTANNYGGIGAIKKLEPVNFGVNYTTATVNTVGVGGENANVVAVIEGSGITSGVYEDDSGKVNYKRIQDSYYYQEYSYVIRSGIEISKYKNVLKKLLHPAGLEVFGEIQIINSLDLKMKSDDAINIENVFKIIKTIIIEPVEDLIVRKVIDFNFFSSEYSFYADVPIDNLPGQANSIANSIISTYQYYTFLTPYGEAVYYQIERNIKLPGTVTVYSSNSTVIGTGTVFTDNFSAGDSFVVLDRTGAYANNKFVIDTISSDTVLTVKVAPLSDVFNANLYALAL